MNSVAFCPRLACQALLLVGALILPEGSVSAEKDPGEKRVVPDRRVRVLLFAAAPTREFQFLRTALYREVRENRAELSIFLQSGKEDHVDQDVEPERLLADFPNKLGPNDKGKRHMSVSDYDVVVAFDPDWVKLKLEQRKLLKDWVETHAGGVIFVAGPINTYQLARPGGIDLSAVQSIYPVVLKDSRLHGLGISGLNFDATRPYPLNFTPKAKHYPFLQLDDDGLTPTAGWNGFFWNNEKEPARPGDRPKKGFFSYYPVERLKPASEVIATFAGPKETRIGDRTDAFKDQQPFLVAMNVGNGRTLYLSSGEFWRLRGYKDGFHERLWLGMIRYVAAGPVKAAQGGQIVMPRNAAAGAIPIEVQMQAKDALPTVEVRKLKDDTSKPLTFKLKAQEKKPGWYVGVVNLPDAGDYEVRVAIPGSKDYLSYRLMVRPADGPEKSPPKELPKAKDPPVDKGSEFKSLFKPRVKVLVIDGEGARGRKDGQDSFCVDAVIQSIPKNLYEAVFADKLDPKGAGVKALDRDDLASYGAIFLLNVPELTAKQLANLEKFSKAGGGIAFFLGPNVSSAYYNKHLFKDGKGVFPVQLEKTYFPPANERELKDKDTDDFHLLLRDDLFPAADRYPIFGAIFDNPRQRDCLRHLPIRRYFKSVRGEASKALELATLPNGADASVFAQQVAAITQQGQALRDIYRAREFAKVTKPLSEGLRAIETKVKPGSEAKAYQLVLAIDAVMLAPELKDFWKNADPNVRALLEQIIRLRHQARYGDPLIVTGQFGKGKVVAVMTSAGKQWTDFPGGCTASIIYAPFIWETVNYLTTPEAVKVNRAPADARPPRFLGTNLDHEPRFLTPEPRRGKKDDVPAHLADACLVTPDALIRFRGQIADDAGLADAHWIVEVQPVEIIDGKFGKILPAEAPVRIPLATFFADQEQRAYIALCHNIVTNAKDKTLPTGVAPTHAVADETGLDLRRHFPKLKAKDDEPQNAYLVKVWLSATSSNPKAGTSRTEKPFVFLVVSENELLAHVFRRGEKTYERLEKALEMVRAVQTSLEEQRKVLREPGIAVELVARRVNQMRSAINVAKRLADAASGDAQRMENDLAVNRVRKDRQDKVEKIASAHDFSRGLGDADFWKAETALGEMSRSLEAGKKDNLLKHAASVGDALRCLDKRFVDAEDVLTESLVEAKLIELLVVIEKEKHKQRKKP